MIGLKRGLLWKRHLLIDTKQKTNELCQFIDIDGDGKREWVANQWNGRCHDHLHQDEKESSMARNRSSKWSRDRF